MVSLLRFGNESLHEIAELLGKVTWHVISANSALVFVPVVPGIL